MEEDIRIKCVISLSLSFYLSIYLYPMLCLILLCLVKDGSTSSRGSTQLKKSNAETLSFFFMPYLFW